MTRWLWSSPGRRNKAAAARQSAPEAAADGAAAAGGDTDADVGRRFRRAWALGDAATAVPELLPVRLTRACVAVLPIAGAGLSLLSDCFRVPLGASDDAAETAERLQFTQGEGPCLDAAHSGRVMFAQGERIEQRWPAFGEQFLNQTPFRATMSLPLPLTHSLIGALDLYLLDDAQIEAVSLADAAIVSEQIVQALQLAQAITRSVTGWSDEPEPPWMNSPSAQHRTNVWVAMGMVMTQLEVPAADALATLRGYAYSHNTDVDDLAQQLTDGSLKVQQIDA
jgi:hypothetical protein